MSRVQALFPLVLAFAFLAGCDKDKPKEEKKSEPVPVPSDLVFNDFLPQSGGSGSGLGVRDAGSDGALANVGTGGGEAPAGEPAPAAGPEKLVVTEAGADPKAVRKYAFVANRVDKRTLSITQSMAQSMGGQTSPAKEQTLKIALEVTPKLVKPTGATMELKLQKVEMPGLPPQAAPMLAALGGLAGTFETSSRGDASEVQFAGTQQMQNQLAEPVIAGVSQATQLLVVQFPDAPIGVGAKWELPPTKDPNAEQSTKRFTLKELNADGAVVEAEIEIKVPKRQQPAQRGQPAMTVEVDGKGKYTYALKFDHVSTKVEGELTVNEKIEAVDPRSGQKQQVMQVQKSKHLLESPAK